VAHLGVRADRITPHVGINLLKPRARKHDIAVGILLDAVSDARPIALDLGKDLRLGRCGIRDCALEVLL